MNGPTWRLVPVWRVMAWNPVRLAWRVRSSHATHRDAAEHAQALQYRHPRLRVRVIPATRRVPVPGPPVNNETRAWRLDRAAAMSDRADAVKRYKSPG